MNAPGSLTIYENQDVWSVARLVRPNGVKIETSDVTAANSANPIMVYIYDITEGSTEVIKYGHTAGTGITADTSLAKASVLFDTLQTDGYWSGDTTGYNFRHKVAGSNFSEGGKRYRIEYAIQTSSWGKLYVITEVTTKALSHT
jgi:hypothetical protein